MRSAFPWLVLAAMLAGCSAAESTSADRFTADGELVALSGGDAGAASACFTCHGLDGRGNGAGAPRLAGLHVGYLASQLEGYANGRRQHPEMQAIARKLAPDDRQKVSAYYAAMPWAPADGAGGRVPEAPPLYVVGDPARGLAACADCHGLAGEGVGAANPPLAGQPAGYLAEQLMAWRRSERRNDPDNIMLRISRRLTQAEIVSLSAYASALPGGPPRPESPEASLAERRADPRNDASTPPRREAGSAPSESR